jgi:hypothetical protein
LVIVPIVVIGGVFASQWTQSVSEDIERFESEHIAQEAHDLEIVLDNVIQDVFLISEYRSVQQLGQTLLLNSNTSPEVEVAKPAVLDDFVYMASIREIYGQIRFLDVTGFEVARVDYDNELNATSQPEGTDKGDRSYFLQAIGLNPGELYVSPLELNREGSPSRIQGTLDNNSVVPVIRYATPITTEHPETGRLETAGVLVINLYMKSIIGTIEPSVDNSFNYLVNSEGYYLYNSVDNRYTFGFEDGIELVGGIAEFNMQTTTEETFYFPNNIIGDIRTEFDEVVFTGLELDGKRYILYWAGLS